MIAFYATREHYVSHLAPVWRALDDRAIPFFMPSVPAVLAHAQMLGVPATVGRPPNDGLLVAASSVDLGAHPRCVLVEHGAGQSYVEVDHHSWSGGEGRQNVVLFVVPNRYAYERNKTRYPKAKQIVCAPYVERLLALPRSEDGGWCDVVLGRHWDSYLAPELSSAWTHHWEAIRSYALANRDWVGMHFHPRCADVGRALAREWQVEYVGSFEELVARTEPHTVLVIDNSSAGFEWAALDRPVVWLNAPTYRRDVEHGLRFWSHVDVGTQVDEPEQLHAAILESLKHDPMADRRRELAADVFPVVEGSAQIAADAIRRLA